MRGFPPITIPDPGRGARYGAPGYRDHAFNFPDKQGMYRVAGERTHGGTDWFGVEGGDTPLHAPWDGKIVQAYRTSDRSGQVYGGVIKLQRPDGIVFVARHVDPLVVLGQTVDAGQQIATVTRWIDAGDHAHIEIWKRLSGGYWYHNAIDPKTVAWSTSYDGEGPPPPDLYLDLIINGRRWKIANGKGWQTTANAMRWLEKNELSENATASIAYRSPKRKGQKPYVWNKSTGATPANVRDVALSVYRTFRRHFR